MMIIALVMIGLVIAIAYIILRRKEAGYTPPINGDVAQFMTVFTPGGTYYRIHPLNSIPLGSIQAHINYFNVDIEGQIWDNMGGVVMVQGQIGDIFALFYAPFSGPAGGYFVSDQLYKLEGVPGLLNATK